MFLPHRRGIIVSSHFTRVAVQCVGATDLLFAFYQGIRVDIDAGMLGAAFFIPTAVVPALLVTHGLIFWLLVQHRRVKEGIE